MGRIYRLSPPRTIVKIRGFRRTLNSDWLPLRPAPSPINGSNELPSLAVATPSAVPRPVDRLDADDVEQVVLVETVRNVVLFRRDE